MAVNRPESEGAARGGLYLVEWNGGMEWWKFMERWNGIVE